MGYVATMSVQAKAICVIIPHLHVGTSIVGDTDPEGFSHLLPQLACTFIDIADQKRGIFSMLILEKK